MTERPRFERLDRLFREARDLDAAARSAYLDEHCGDDDALRAEVESLLAHDERPHALLHLTPATGDPDAPASTPERIGSYRILGVIGVGGMGVVYRAEQSSPRRVVALKVIRPGIVTPGLLRRFAHEAQVLGRLQHPGIAQIHEAGTARVDGVEQPFLVMELVEGVPITEYADGRDARETMALVAEVGDAVQHAHEHRVVHRDLKPGNILVDADGRPRILDFGVARIADVAAPGATVLTRAGQIVGTLAYMSPEQVSGAAPADERSDVYALGVVAYRLLAGRLPHDVTDRPLPEAARIVCADEPTSLSAVDRSFRGDLDTIIATALEKAPSRRYASAAAFAEDLRRWLADEPIRARPASAWYQLGKFARRHRALVSGLVATAIVLVVGAVVSGVLAAWAMHQRDLKEAQRVEAVFNGYVANIAAAEAAIRASRVVDARSYLERCPETLRDWEWGHLMRRTDRSALVFREHGREWNVKDALFLPGGRRVASSSDDASILIWDRTDGAVIHRLARPGRDGHASWVHAMELSPTGERLASASEDGSVRIWSAATGELEAAFADLGMGLNQVRWHPDGRRLTAVRRDRSRGGFEMLVTIDAVTGEHETWGRHDAAIGSLAITRDGSRLVTAGADGVTVWDVATRSVADRWPLVSDPECRVALAPDDRRVALGTLRGDVWCWDLETGARIERWPAHPSPVWGVAFSPDGALIATASGDRSVAIWDGTTFARRATLLGHEDEVRRVRFDADGTTLASVSNDGSVRLWSADAGDVRTLTGHTAAVLNAEFHPAGDRLVSSGSDRLGVDGTVIEWDLATGIAERRLATDPPEAVRWVEYSPDGGVVAHLVGRRRTVELWRPDADTVRSFDVEALPRMLDFSGDGRRLAVASNEGGFVHDVETGRMLGAMQRGRWCTRIAFGPDDRLLAMGLLDNDVELHDAATLAPVATLAHPRADPDGPSWPRGMAFSHDGRLLAVSYLNGWLVAWDVETRSVRWATDRSMPKIQDLAFSADDRRLAGAGRDHTVRLWETATGRAVATLHGHAYIVYDVAFSRDGTRLASTSRDMTIRVWEGR